jgi:hypothetical protein
MKQFLALTLLLAGAVSPALGQSVPDRPVMLQPMMLDGRPIAPAGSVAEVVGLKKAGGDGFASVRGAPSLQGAERGRLTLGQHVIMLNEDESTRKTGFVGVLYVEAARDQSADLEQVCGIENPPSPTKTEKKLYTGPCKSGWVARRFVKVLAD